MCGTFSLKTYDGELTYGDGKRVITFTTWLWYMVDDIVHLLVVLHRALLKLLRFLVDTLMIMFIIILIRVIMERPRPQSPSYCLSEMHSNHTSPVPQASILY
ncbi:hypothetical protein FS837_010542 [Tulasnella sp. UAMH 9824]|nr:hypothetical protein FS837_010542 [Tulasnella sp. UAMH 9824]